MLFVLVLSLMDQQQKQTAAPAAATLRQYACVGAANSPLPSACPLQALAWRTAVCKPTVSLVDCRPYIGCVLVDPEPQSCTCCTAIEGLWSSIECSHGSESKMLHTIARALMKRDISYTATPQKVSLLAACIPGTDLSKLKLPTKLSVQQTTSTSRA